MAAVPQCKGQRVRETSTEAKRTSEEALCYLHHVLQVTEMAGQCVAHMCSNTSKAVCTHTCLHMHMCTHRSVYTHVRVHTTLQRVCLAPVPGECVPDGQMSAVLERSGLSRMLWKAEQVNNRPYGATSSQVPSMLSDEGLPESRVKGQKCTPQGSKGTKSHLDSLLSTRSQERNV